MSIFSLAHDELKSDIVIIVIIIIIMIIIIIFSLKVARRDIVNLVSFCCPCMQPVAVSLCLQSVLRQPKASQPI